jgi:PadR family transcriptional regulator, regulatory protein PadR
MAGSSQDLLPGTLDMLILKTLDCSPNHGYGIAQYIQRVSDEALRVGEGSLYPALQRLLLEDWVTAAWGVSSTGRNVRLYKITPGGRKQLRRELDRFAFLVGGINRILEAI